LKVLLYGKGKPRGKIISAIIKWTFVKL
jgi:hypothetical protein